MLLISTLSFLDFSFLLLMALSLYLWANSVLAVVCFTDTITRQDVLHSDILMVAMTSLP